MSDYGSWFLVSRRLSPYREGYIESWCGLSDDLDKLPHTGETGSTAYCVDTGNSYMFEKTTDRWYRMATQQGQGEGGIGEPYTGTYEVTPKAFETQSLPTAQKTLTKDLTVVAIPYAETSNLANGTTATIAR